MAPVSRRAALQFIGLGSVGFAGCFGDTPGGNNTDPDDQENPWDENITQGPLLEVTIPESPDEVPASDADLSLGATADADVWNTIDIGTREGVNDEYLPHRVLLLNEGDVPAIEFGVADVLKEEIIHHERHEIPEGQLLEVFLLTPSKYLLNIAVSEDLQEMLLVDCNLFDCNDSYTSIAVHSTGEIDSNLLSSLLTCPSYSC